MAGMGPSPKPGAVNRNPKAYDWVTLPAEGRAAPAPDLPPIRDWSLYTLSVWQDLWSTPMSAMWREDDPALVRYVVLTEEMLTTDKPVGPLVAALVQLDDRLGLTPKARMQLRWILPELGDRAPAPVHPLRIVETPAQKRRAAIRKKKLSDGGT